MIFTGAVSSDQSCGAEKTAPLVRLRVELAIVARRGRLNTPPVAALSVEFAMLTRLVASNSPVTVWLIVTESIETACGSWYTGKPRLNRRFWLLARAVEFKLPAAVHVQFEDAAAARTRKVRQTR